MTKRRLASFLASSFADDAPHSNAKTVCAEGSRDVISAISSWLEEMVRHYDSREWTMTSDGLKRTEEFAVSGFHGRPLSASIEGFLRRISSLARLDENVFLVAAVYICRIIEKAPGLPISSCTVHRLLLQAVVVGAKFSLDHPRSNKMMASFADVPLKKFNQLEVKFLCLIQYDLAVSPNDIAMARAALGMLDEVPLVEETVSCKRIKLGECGGTTYSTIAVGTSGTTEEVGIASVESEMDEMSHLTEDNNYNTSSPDMSEDLAVGVITPCISACSTNSMTAVSPEWSTQSGGDVETRNNSNDDKSSVNQQHNAPTQGIMQGSKTGSSSPPQMASMPTPERKLLCNNVIAHAAE